MCLNVPAKNVYLWIQNSASIPKNYSFFCFRCKHGVHVGGLINFGQWRMLKQDSTLSRWARSYHIWTDLFLGGLAGSVYRDLALSSKRFIPPWLLSLVSDNRLQCSSRPPVFFSRHCCVKYLSVSWLWNCIFTLKGDTHHLSRVPPCGALETNKVKINVWYSLKQSMGWKQNKADDV